jgi:hypothetical protein
MTTSTNDRGTQPLRKLHADPDAAKAIEKAVPSQKKPAGPSPELVATLAAMSDEQRTLVLVKAARCLPVQFAMWGL